MSLSSSQAQFLLTLLTSSSSSSPSSAIVLSSGQRLYLRADEEEQMERSHEPFFHPALVTKFFPKPVLVPDFLMAYKFLWQLKFNIHFAKV